MVISKNIDEHKATLIEEQNHSAKSASLKQQLIAFACISFFPLLYLIGSTIVKYFG